MTWLGTSLYIIDPVLGRLVAWYSLDTGDIKLTANTLCLCCCEVWSILVWVLNLCFGVRIAFPDSL